MHKYMKTALLFISLSIISLIFPGCGDKQDNSPQALETKKIVESFIQSYNKGDADSCIGLLSKDIVVEQKALHDVKSQDVRSVHEALKSNIAWKHNWKIIKYLNNSENSITLLVDESGDDIKLIGIDSISSENSFEVKDGKIAKIVTVIDRKLAEQLASKTAGGIGIKTDIKPDRIIITDVTANFPAEKAGLKQGDDIMAIDGINCSDMRPGEQTIRIRGPVNSKVLLKVRHSDSNKTFDIELIRADLSKLPSK